MNNDHRLAVMYGELCAVYIARGEAANAAILGARAAHFAGIYADTAEWQERRGAARLLWAIWKGWNR